MMNLDVAEFDSPIEFVIVGPVAGRDAVLAKSKGAGIDLIGLSMDSFDFQLTMIRSDLLSSLFPHSRQVRSVRVPSISDLRPSSDVRTSDMILAWAGAASESDVKRIVRSFNLQSRAIAKLASEGDRAALEIALAPVVLACSEAHERRSRLRRLVIATTVMYITIGILGSGLVSFSYFAKNIFSKY